MNRYVVGIDIGTTAVKLLVLNEQHEAVYDRSKEHPLFSEHPGWAEEDALLWWDNTCALLRDAMSYLVQLNPGTPYEVRAIGVSGMVPAIVLVGENGVPLRNSIQQNDARCVEEITEISIRLDQQRMFQETGGYTNQQHVLPRLLWVKHHEPDVWSRIRHVCGSYDWIVHCLTGTWSLEENWAVESGLYNLHTRHWISDYFGTYDLPVEWFPQVYESQDMVGKVLPEVSRLTGLPSGTAVIAGSADHIASALSAGVVEEGDLLIKFGGAGDILLCTDGLVTHEKLFIDFHDIPGKYLLNGCMASSGSLVRWFAEQFVPTQTGDDRYKNLDDQAERIGPGSEGLVILPYLLGEKTPIFDPNARGVFFGLTLQHTPAHVFRAILESVIYGFRHHIDVLSEKGLRPKRVFATNGGAKSKLWLQIAADIIGLPLTSFKNHPGSALGVAFLAGKAAGLYTDWSEVLQCIPETDYYMPNVKATETYDVTYGIYRRLYESLKEDFTLVSTHFRVAAHSEDSH